MSNLIDRAQPKDQSSNLIDRYKRQFLGGLGITAAAVTLAPGVILREVQAKPDEEAVTNKVRWGMLIDTNKLPDGGEGMVAACKKEHGWGDDPHSSPAQQSQWVRKVTFKDKLTKHETSLPVMCQHCETAPCVDVCPTGASFKRADGIVLVDKHICIGCRYCIMACPYKARSFVHEKLENQQPHSPRGIGTVESCTLCVHRIDKGEQPACIEAAPPKAAVFGDLNDPESTISKALAKHGAQQIRADLGLNTGVRYWGI
jgi:molybdopterin-containing oxidoreductase family iron-sulfur binding subunit